MQRRANADEQESLKEQEIQGSPIFYWESKLVTAYVEQGTVKELLMLLTQEEAATCKATLLLMPTAFSPGWSEGAGAQRSLVCSKGAVDHRLVCRHANTDINPETSDRHHRSRIDNT